jgi:hypothetical protein
MKKEIYIYIKEDVGGEGREFARFYNMRSEMRWSLHKKKPW